MQSIKTRSMIVSLVCLLIVSDFTVFGEDKAVRQRLRADTERISTFWKESKGSDVDTDQISNIAADLETNWKNTDKKKYAELMFKLVGPMRLYGKSDQAQCVAARQCLLSAMEEPDQVPIKLQINLSLKLMETWPAKSNINISNSELAQRRSTDALILLCTWQHLDSLIDPNWNPDQRPPQVSKFPNDGNLNENDPNFLATKAAQEQQRAEAGVYFEQAKLR